MPLLSLLVIPALASRKYFIVKLKIVKPEGKKVQRQINDVR